MKTFDSIEAFQRHLQGILPKVNSAEQSAVHDGGRVIQREAQHEIGEYQEADGPFPAWAPLSKYTLDGWDSVHGEHYPGKVDLGFSPPDNPLLRTGELRDHIELSVSHNHAVVGVPAETVGDGTHENPTRDIGDVALWLEFGDRYMPPRSFLGRAAHRKAHEVVGLIGFAVFAALCGESYRSHFDSD